MIPAVEGGDRPRWSVVIAASEAGEQLAGTLRGVLAQDRGDMEVEVLGPASIGEGVAAVVRELGGDEVAFEGHLAGKGHASRVLNGSLRRARGHLVHLLRSGDNVEDDFYRRIGSLLREWPDAGAALCRLSTIDEAGVRRELGPLLSLQRGPLHDWHVLAVSGHLLEPAGFVVRRSTYERTGGFDESIRRFGAVWEMGVRIAAANGVAYDPDPLACSYRRSGDALGDLRGVAANVRDLRHVLESNRATLRRAGVAAADEIDAAARRRLREAFARHVTVHVPAVEASRGRVNALRRRRKAVDLSPLPLPQVPPGAMEDALWGADLRPLPPSPPPKDHRMYAVGNDRILHVYGPPADRIRRSLPDRRLIDALALPGIPRLDAADERDGHVWVLEGRIDGHPIPTDDVERWLGRVTDQLVAVAGPPGPPLRTTAFWDDHRDAAVALVDRRLRPAADVAWARAGELPARVLHGDAQRRNFVLSSERISLVDWEGAWRFGLPALDILFWRLTAAGGVDVGLASRLASGEDDPVHPLGEALERVGVRGELVPQVVLATLTVLALGERRRWAREIRHRHLPTPFRAMLDEVGSLLR